MTARPLVGRAAVLLIAVGAGCRGRRSRRRADGAPVDDTLLAGVGVGLITIVGARAPWWVLVLDRRHRRRPSTRRFGRRRRRADPPLVARIWRLDRPELLAVSTALTFNVLIPPGTSGSSASRRSSARVCAALVFVTGIRGFPKRVRRAAWIGVAAPPCLSSSPPPAPVMRSCKARHVADGRVPERRTRRRGARKRQRRRGGGVVPAVRRRPPVRERPARPAVGPAGSGRAASSPSTATPSST